MKFASKKDLWLSVVLWFVSLFAPFVVFYEFFTGNLPISELYISIVVSLLLVGFIGWIWFGTHYTVTDTDLLIVSGPLRKRIPFEDILSVKASSNPISSPALSLKRLRVAYKGYRSIHISPDDRIAFMELLKTKCPEARIDPVE